MVHLQMLSSLWCVFGFCYAFATLRGVGLSHCLTFSAMNLCRFIELFYTLLEILISTAITTKTRKTIYGPTFGLFFSSSSIMASLFPPLNALNITIIPTRVSAKYQSSNKGPSPPEKIDSLLYRRNSTSLGGWEKRRETRGVGVNRKG